MSNVINATKTSRVIAELGDRLRNGEWGADVSLPSLALLSEEYQVSAGTVALALKSLEQEGLVKVLPRQGVVAMGTPLRAPDCLGETPTIAIVTENQLDKTPLHSSYYGSLTSTIISYASEKGGVVTILPVQGADSDLILERCKQFGVKGVIIPRGDGHRHVRRLQDIGFPAISINMPLGPSAVNYCAFDHKRSIMEAVRVLCEHGHKRIGFLSFQSSTPGLIEDNKPDILFYLCEHGSLYDVNQYWQNIGPNSNGIQQEKLNEAMDKLFALKERPTAIFCRTSMGAGVLEWAKMRGISVPEDLSVIGGIGLPFESAISAFSSCYEELGALLVESLYSIIQNPFLTIQKFVPIKYVDYGTVAPVRKN